MTVSKDTKSHLALVEGAAATLTPADSRSHSPDIAPTAATDDCFERGGVAYSKLHQQQQQTSDKPALINGGSSNSDDPDYLRMILTARVYDVAQETPLTKAANLSARTGMDIYLKREDLQPVFSFKLRGAYNKMQSLTPEERAAGVIACSAGNHAQGVALAAKNMGIKATIVMPVLTPEIKWKNVKKLGAEVVLFGDDFDGAKQECSRLSAAHGLTNIPPYDDPHVIAGQGTVGVEILRQHPLEGIHAIFCAVGGGGLVAGIAAYVKRLCPSIRIIGVETVDSCAMTQSLRAGKRVELDEVGLFADGAAVRVVGKETFRLCEEYLDEMILVTTDEICAAIKDVFEDTRSILEPAGGVSVAGAKRYAALHPELHGSTGSLVAVTSGANMNFSRLRFVAERASLGENREALFSVAIPEQPGAFIKLHSLIYPRDTTEFSYRYSSPDAAHIFLSCSVLGTDREKDVATIIQQLKEHGMHATDLSHNELAKSHARYLVGGRSSVPNERLFRFEFPERPGALKRFLGELQAGFNISLFHYRNIGSDNGRVLVGIQVPSDAESKLQFDQFLQRLGYPYVEETDNAVFDQFLRS